MVQVLVCDHALIDGRVNNVAHVTRGEHIDGSDIVAAVAAVSGSM